MFSPSSILLDSPIQMVALLFKIVITAAATQYCNLFWFISRISVVIPCSIFSGITWNLAHEIPMNSIEIKMNFKKILTSWKLQKAHFLGHPTTFRPFLLFSSFVLALYLSLQLFPFSPLCVSSFSFLLFLCSLSPYSVHISPSRVPYSLSLCLPTFYILQMKYMSCP